MNEMAQYLLMMSIIGWASGISIYLTIALLGICGHLGLIILPGGLEILQHPVIIALAVLMYLIEFFADKIPYVDSMWDTIHTFVRPVGAAAMVAMAGTEYDALTQTAVSVVAGTIALNNHTVKSTTRLAINTSPEPVSNVAASVAEDSAVLMMFYFYIKHPIIAGLLLILTLVGSFFVLKGMWHLVKKVFNFSKKEETTT